MHKSLKGSLTQEAVDRRRYDFRFRKATQRKVSCTFQSHRFIKFTLQVGIHRHSRKFLNQKTQQDKTDIAVSVSFRFHRCVCNLLLHFLEERRIQPQTITDLQGVISGFNLWNIFLFKCKIRIRPCGSSQLQRMPCIFAGHEQSAFITIFIDGFPIKSNSGRQAGLMVKQFLNGYVFLVSTLKERQIVCNSVRQIKTSLIVKFH